MDHGQVEWQTCHAHCYESRPAVSTRAAPLFPRLVWPRLVRFFLAARNQNGSETKRKLHHETNKEQKPEGDSVTALQLACGLAAIAGLMAIAIVLILRSE
jgi:hypothetical protein